MMGRYYKTSGTKHSKVATITIIVYHHHHHHHHHHHYVITTSISPLLSLSAPPTLDMFRLDRFNTSTTSSEAFFANGFAGSGSRKSNMTTVSACAAISSSSDNVRILCELNICRSSSDTLPAVPNGSCCHESKRFKCKDRVLSKSRKRNIFTLDFFFFLFPAISLGFILGEIFCICRHFVIQPLGQSHSIFADGACWVCFCCWHLQV